MRMVSILKPALFIYECVRIIILSFTLVFQLSGSSAILWLAFTAAGALFPLMALFIWLDISRYRPYLPLFIAGKCIGIFSLLGWFIVFGQVTMIKGLHGNYIMAEFIFLSGDLLALAAILFIFKDRNITEKPHVEAPERRFTSQRLTNQQFGDTEENNADNSNS